MPRELALANLALKQSLPTTSISKHSLNILKSIPLVNMLIILDWQSVVQRRVEIISFAMLQNLLDGRLILLMPLLLTYQSCRSISSHSSVMVPLHTKSPWSNCTQGGIPFRPRIETSQHSPRKPFIADLTQLPFQTDLIRFEKLAFPASR
jgi:hypothetical protein